MMKMPRAAKILIVEDNSGDEFLVRDAFERGKARHELEVARDGEAALDRLRGLGEHADKPTPDIILLDLNLPRKEFIATIAIFFLAMSLTQVPALWTLGILTLDRLLLAFLALIPMFLGIPIGAWAARFLSKQAFDRLILSLLAVIAVKLIWDALQAGL